MAAPQTAINPATLCINRPDDRMRRLERRCWVALLILANLSLLSNAPATALIFDPTAIAGGQWWRLFTWPLAHVSRYHLLLDGAAFLLLLHGIEEQNPVKRASFLFFSAAGSLLLPLAATPTLSQTGLCGLSGVAHGLAAVSALEILCTRNTTLALRRVGALLLVGLLAKTGLELWHEDVLFASLHLGSIGVPVVETHAGGTLGGIFAFLLHQLASRWRLAKRPSST